MFQRPIVSVLFVLSTTYSGLALADSGPNEPEAISKGETLRDGWQVLSQPYTNPSLVDGFTFEWQYFMVHDEDSQFTGSIGYVLVDPRGRLGKVAESKQKASLRGTLIPVSIMPSGASVAIAGRWQDGTDFSNYERFQDTYKVGIESKNFSASDLTRGFSADLIEAEKVSAGKGVFQLKGQTSDASWDLLVTPDSFDDDTDSPANPFGPITGTDVGILPGERWTVHMQWPRTRVEGQMTDLKSGKVYEIKGHGYRENSWGRWNFALDGWAFSVVSDSQTHVQWAWQTYHKSKDMDWLDLSFEDQGQVIKRRFLAKKGELQWTMNNWFFHPEARQCVPNSVEVIAEDAEYRVRANYDLTGRQRPMLSSATPLTGIFVIMIHTPIIRGSIENIKTGEIVARFEGQGGGEFSTTRSLWTSVSNADCASWGRKFHHER